jgi:hypothetical protein
VGRLKKCLLLRIFYPGTAGCPSGATGRILGGLEANLVPTRSSEPGDLLGGVLEHGDAAELAPGKIEATFVAFEVVDVVEDQGGEVQ